MKWTKSYWIVRCAGHSKCLAGLQVVPLLGLKSVNPHNFASRSTLQYDLWIQGLSNGCFLQGPSVDPEWTKEGSC